MKNDSAEWAFGSRRDPPAYKARAPMRPAAAANASAKMRAFIERLALGHRVGLFGLATLAASCSEPSTTLMADWPEGAGSFKVATFYGEESIDDCENYRRMYASYCNWAEAQWPVCGAINPETLDATRCEKD